MAMHLLDSKALSSEPAIESLENVGDPGSALGFQACPAGGERMSWGSAELVPTSRPLRSESALGSVVPLPCPPARLRVTVSPEVH